MAENESEKKKDIEIVKENYLKLAKTYSLPEFEKLQEDFDLDKAINKDDLFLLRSVRRSIAEKFSGYLHLFETLINPSGSPSFVFTFLKGLKEEDKKKIKETYKQLARNNFSFMKLDAIYSEKKEAEAIIRCYENWQEMKVKILALIERFEQEFDNNSKEEKEKSYFG